jgi:hypothetical protein
MWKITKRRIKHKKAEEIKRMRRKEKECKRID